MFHLDPANAFHARVADRLNKEIVGWLTTMGANGVPQPNPVWFLWDGGDTLLVYSQDNHKVRHIARNPGVSFNLNSNASGGDVITLTGTAVIDDNQPTADQNPTYLEKYASGIKGLGSTPAQFAAGYHVPIVVTITKLRGF